MLISDSQPLESMKKIICKIILIVTFVIFLSTAAYASTKTKKNTMQEETVEAFPFRIGDDHSPSMKDKALQETVEPCPLGMEETVEAFPFLIGDDHSPSMKDYPPQETVEPCPLK